MTAKQNIGRYAPDASKYATVTDGSGNLKTLNSSTGSSKQTSGSQAPDGSIYLTLTDGSGNLR